MRGALYIAAAVLVALTAFWAYRISYKAVAALDRVQALRAEIAREHEALVVLRAEWAWLSAPERLSALLAAHGDALGLAPLSGAQFAALAEVPPPPPESFWARADPGVFPMTTGDTLALQGAP